MTAHRTAGYHHSVMAHYIKTARAAHNPRRPTGSPALHGGGTATPCRALKFKIMDDRDKDPAVVLPYLVGRPLAATEVYEAFGYRKSAYYKAARENRLISADNLIKVARYFGLNPVDLQVRYGLIEPEAVTEYVQSDPDLPRLRDLRPDPTKPPV